MLIGSRLLRYKAAETKKSIAIIYRILGYFDLGDFNLGDFNFGDFNFGDFNLEDFDM